VRRIRFRLPRAAPRVTELATHARIVMVGDWGTGEGVALTVAAQMQRAIEGAGDREVHVVHLGDVYYAGTRWEAKHRFLDHWPVREAGADRVRSWCLNGNHDMYSAGEGLFEVILADPRFAGQRAEDGAVTSEFHLRNADWDIVGLDTSAPFRLTDIRGGAGHIGRGRTVLERLAGSDRRRLLLSHHQPFTDTGKGVADVGNLLQATAPLRDGRGVDAWFWGHEHRLVTYAARAGIRYSACMGHGAVLESPATRTAQPGDTEFRATFRDTDGDEWRMPGFAVLDLDGPDATVTYVDMTGQPWRSADTL
jgi:3',5'-cyclic AMP phosphodiesterase CpdA